ncbi:hypothetical protein ABE82_26725 (plasmid) [Paenibacillus peoriae]|nr:hypothetical protein ABE82_26725 [Paenibacillus peoriae]
MILKTNDFQCPVSGIPVIAYFDDESGIISFSVHLDFEEDTETVRWCYNCRTVLDDLEEAEWYLVNRLSIRETEAKFY